MKSIFLILASILIIYSCASNKQSENNVDIQAKKLIENIDSSTLTFLKSWNYTNRMNQHNIWTKVKDYDSLEYSFLYEPKADTINIEIYNIANFLKDYKVNFNFDTANFTQYRISETNNRIISIYPGGEFSGNKNQISTSISTDSIFKEFNPFDELQTISHYKDKFNFYYCSYIPSKGNFIRFAFSNSNENILYYIPNDIIIKDKNLFNWIDKFSQGKRFGKNWILVKKDDF